MFQGSRKLATLLAALSLSASVMAADEKKTDTPPPPAPPAAPAPWSLGDAIGVNDALKPLKIVMSGWLEVGYTANPAGPKDRINAGRTFDDRSNDFAMNQLAVSFDRAMDTGDSFDWGGRFQFIYGSDARYFHYFGVLDNATDDTVQPAISEAWLSAHLPVLTKGGVDIKGGMFVTLLGAETIDPRTNYLYSHSYMFNYGIAFDHTGILSTIHLPWNLDFTAGVVGGVNTGVTDNNDGVSFHGGLGWANNDKKELTIFSGILAGPETDSSVAGQQGQMRVISDTVITWTATDSLTLIADINYGYDNAGSHSEWYGIAGYAVLKVNDQLSFIVRGEIFRDDDGFVVAKFGNNDDMANIPRGINGAGLDSATGFGPPATYYAVTLGLNYKPCANVTIRPEVRFDFADVSDASPGAGGGPFDDGLHRQQVTTGIDVILNF